VDRSRRFYRDVLGLAAYREFGPADDPALVFFLGEGLLDVSGHAPGPPRSSVMIWLPVRDVRAAHDRLAAAGVEVPAEHPLRRDQR
jgi:catechol 2,3-dioxygenase-like lactoylglutathione lyase family enzyme